MANTHEDGKILVKSGSDLNIFKDCLHTYPDRAKFPLNRFVLLYAITTYLQNLDKVTESDFKRRIRIVNNLIQNSRDEISDRQDRNRMPAILKQTEAIILTGTVKDISPNFNVHQILEEKEKIKYLESNPNMASVIFELEDHDLLKGQISIIGIENLNYHERFESLFECDKEKVDCAMMAIGNYGQMEGNKRRYQYGTKSNSSAWENLFHKSSNSGFQKTSDILISLLDKYEKFSNEILEKIAKDYLEKCEVEEKYPFRYYYIKYDEYRPDSYGKMWNDDADAEDETEAKGYTFRVMQTESRLSESSYAPALKAASDSHLSKKDYGDRLIFDNVYITYEKDSYLIRKNEDDSIVGSIEFKQNADGIDIEDRIIRLKNYIEENL